MAGAALGALLFAALYAAVAAQQFTHYAAPAGMDLTIAGIVSRDAVGMLVQALWPVLLTVNVILLGFHVVAGALLGFAAGRFWQAVYAWRERPLSALGRAALVLASLSTVAGLAFCTVAIRYPFQLDHLLNGRGGLLRRAHSALTAHVDPALCAALTWIAIAVLATPVLARAVRRPRAMAPLCVVGVGIAGWMGAASPAGSNAGPNVVLILLESARGDFVSVNGHPWPTSPRIDELVAGRGVSFTRAWAHANGTVESVVSLMSSTYLHRHGIRSMFHGEEFAQPALPVLPALLREHGYATRVVTDWDGDVTYFTERVLPGFDHYDVAEFGVVNYVKQAYAQHFLFHALTDNAAGHRLFRVFYQAGGGFAPAGSDAYYRTRIAGHLAELAHAPRFFLTLFFSNAHMNYRCAYPYYRRFADAAYEGPNKYQALSNPLQERPDGLEHEAQQIRALYAGCMRALDDNVGFVIDTLAGLGLDARTLLIITGDHGDRLPDHRSFRYGRNGAWLDPGEFHVPLVIAGPGIPPAAPRTIDAHARHVDVMPTILDLLGLPSPPGVEGVSLVPLIAGSERDLGLDVFGVGGFHWTPVPPPALGYPPMTHLVALRLTPEGSLIPRYFLRPECLGRIEEARPRFIRTGRYQLNYRPLMTGTKIELYDWTVDPANERDLARVVPDIAARLASRLFAWSLADRELIARNGRLEARDPAAVTCRDGMR
jgi:arylsulfatase A-like enzyme